MDYTVKKTWLIQSREGKLTDHYSYKTDKDILGEGSYGKVIKAQHITTGEMRAIKIIPKNRITNQDKFKKEIEILRNLDHPHIIKLYEIFEDHRNVYLIMELCTGGELFDRIIKKGHFTEKEARNIFTQIVKAIFYCHESGICHRDLKPENFLLLDETETAELKVIDFGFAREFQEINEGTTKKLELNSRLGTPYYISPEVLKGKYNELCDVWSLGVILYIFLSGYPPFAGDTDAQILDKIKKGKYDFSGSEWSSVSESAKDIILHMLCKPETRYTAGAILQHPWMHIDEEKLDKPLQVNFNSMKSFRNAQRLKKAALTFIASQLSEKEILELMKLFERLDLNNDGTLTFEEIQAGLNHLDEKKAKEVRAVLEGIDTDHSGSINYTEFIAATMEKTSYLKEERLLTCFKLFDKDGNGKITPDELKEVLGKDDEIDHQNSFWTQIIKEADSNNDGAIDYTEFVNMMYASRSEL